MPIYCCKKWVGGQLKRFMSGSPCSGGAVLCSAPDPPKPPIGGIGPGPGNGDGDGNGGGGTHPIDPGPGPPPPPPGIGEIGCTGGYKLGGGGGGGGTHPEPGPEPDCEKGCRDQYYVAINSMGPEPTDPDQKREYRRKVAQLRANLASCLKNCAPLGEIEPGPGPGPGPTPTECDEGFVKKMIDGVAWCCPVGGGGVGGSPCETGGYELTEGVGMGGGGGDPKEKYPEFNRSGLWAGGWMWHREKEKYYEKASVIAGTWEGTGQDYVCKKHFKQTPGEGGKTWCCPTDEDQNGDGGPGGPGGEFQWSEGLQGLMARIMERANYLLDYPRGLTPQERQGVLNYAIESVKSGEPGAIQSKQDQLARAGLSGSGFEFDEIGKIQRESRGAQTQVRRELAIDDLDRRFNELMGTTGMVQGLSGTLMQSEQIPEILSGARRAEGQSAFNAFMAMLGGSGGGGSTGSSYWQTLMSQLISGQGGGASGGGIWDWLPWLLANSNIGGSNQQSGQWA